MREQATPEELREVFIYDAESGTLRWKINRGAVKAGDEAGCKRPHPGGKWYRKVIYLGVQYFSHRVIFAIVTGSWPEGEIDHDDGDGLNNKWINLRDASRAENAKNLKKFKNNSSGFKGVSWNTRRGVWRAFISCDGKRYYLGSFSEKEDAYKTYCAAAEKLHGEFANFGKET